MGLKTSLERACKNYGRPLKHARDIENQLLREFQRKYHHYSQHIPVSDNTLEWLSLMQHYGAPTRLLDFTYSIYVAAYFALENAKGECAVWAINGKWAVSKSKKLFKKGSDEWKFLKEFITEEKSEAFNIVLRRDFPEKFACPQNPFRLNERLTIQKGGFMCPGDVTLSFEFNLRSLPGWKKKVIKIRIPTKLRRKALDALSNMNISRATLFPGLDGFAQSLKISLPSRWENP